MSSYTQDLYVYVFPFLRRYFFTFTCPSGTIVCLSLVLERHCVRTRVLLPVVCVLEVV